MDLMNDEQPRAVTGSRKLSEFWFKASLLQFSLHSAQDTLECVGSLKLS